MTPAVRISQALWHVIGSLSWCDDYPAAEEAVQLAFADARRRGSVIAFAAASQLRARQGLWTGPVAEAVQDARAAVEGFRAGLLYLPAAGYCLVCGLLEQGEPEQAAATLALVDQRQPSPRAITSGRFCPTFSNNPTAMKLLTRLLPP